MNSVIDNLNDFNDFVVDTLPSDIIFMKKRQCRGPVYLKRLFSPRYHINPNDPAGSGWRDLPYDIDTHYFTLLKDDIKNKVLLFTRPNPLKI